SGLNCDVDYAKSAFKQTRALYGKEDGIQAHTVIQSFKPGEVTPEQCNQLGLELAEKIAPNHQVAVYTHTDKDHYHNHIVINSVDLETGNKYQSNKQQRELVKQANDEICQSHDLSIPKEKSELRYTQAEYSVLNKGKTSWKDEIRHAIDQSQAASYEELGNDLQQNGIKIERITDKTITYRHLEEDKKVRGKKLGEDYDKGGLEIGFNRQNEQREEQARQRELEQARREKIKRDKEREKDWARFNRSTQAIRQNRERSEREERERERKARELEEQNRRAREERARQERENKHTHEKTRGFDFEL
ncbi:relaxase/mobilization nuclease domain-containing protein, partial [Staphylococcus saprophyticus]